MPNRPDRLVRATVQITSTLALGILAACGGGGGSTAATPDAAAATTAFTGALKDATSGAAISGASISLGLKNSATPARVTSASDGSYTLSVPTSALNTAASVILTITAAGSVPCSIEVAGLLIGGETRALTDCGRLSALPAGNYAPVEGAGISRLGNGASGTGDTNTQLSSAALGTSVDLKIGAVNQITGGSNANFVTSLKIRGLDARNCADKITLYQVAGTPLLTAQNSSSSLVDSDATGAFSLYSFTLPVSALASTGDLYMRIESGACGAAPADQNDDFEFYGLSGRFTL